ncbi:hypothetical protein [Plantactinospora sp. BB1]|nr:hypothetical protein [Plantactinospora sp. BB1]
MHLPDLLGQFLQHTQKIGWNSDGTPNPGVPVRTGTTIAGPSGDS